MEMKIKEAPDCPHCGTKMTKTLPPPFNFGDGLGWCVEYFYVCFNDECRLYERGWENLKKNYGKTASYRCMIYPDNGVVDSVCVLSPDAFKGQIVEE
jgi:hypothetical protein